MEKNGTHDSRRRAEERKGGGIRLVEMAEEEKSKTSTSKGY